MNVEEETGRLSVEPSEPAARSSGLPSFPRRVLDVFLSPGRLTEALAREPAWGAAIALGIVLVLSQTLLIPVEVWETLMREQMLARGQDPAGFQGGANIVRVFGLVGGTIGYVLMTMLFVGIVTFVFAFVMGDEGRFKQYLALVAHAFLIPGLIGLALVPLRIAQADPRLTLNLGTFLFFVPEGYFLRFVTLLDLSTLWAWLVVAQGAHAVDPRRRFGTAAAVLIAIFVVVMALLALLPGTG